MQFLKKALTCKDTSMTASDALAFWISIGVVLFVTLD